MVCLGVKPGVAGWKAQTNPLSYGGTPIFQIQQLKMCLTLTGLMDHAEGVSEHQSLILDLRKKGACFLCSPRQEKTNFYVLNVYRPVKFTNLFLPCSSTGITGDKLKTSAGLNPNLWTVDHQTTPQFLLDWHRRDGIFAYQEAVKLCIEILKLLFLIQANPDSFSFIFGLFKQTIKCLQQCEQMSIQNTASGFKPTTFRT